MHWSCSSHVPSRKRMNIRSKSWMDKKCMLECLMTLTHLFLTCYLSKILGMLSMFITPLSFMYIFLIHIRLICEVPQTGDEIKSQDENSTQEKTEGTKLVKLILTPQFWNCLTSTLTSAHILW
jgi:hypothetical protein